MQPRVIFITGTDTGVGKTLLTGLLLHHLRQSGVHALAMKPFCSGGTADVDLLHGLQDGELSRAEINPYYFREAIAPLLASRIHDRPVRLPEVIKKIDRIRRLLQPSVAAPKSDEGGRSAGSLATRLPRRSEKGPERSTLLIEGSGGLLVPLGDDYTVLDLISQSNAEVVVVSRNRLGTINHTLLTVQTLQAAGEKQITVVLMDQSAPDLASKSNEQILTELLAPTPLFSFPYLGPNVMRGDRVRNLAGKHATMLSKIANRLVA